MLKPKGNVVVNTKYILPSIIGNHLTKEQLLEQIRCRAGKVFEVDGAEIASKLGNLLVVNTVLLGAVSALPDVPIKQESFKQAIAGRLKEKYIQLNLDAFQAGRDAVKCPEEPP
jgi:indolepyruvate ferredoxin oxidoreductase beta subunit